MEYTLTGLKDFVAKREAIRLGQPVDDYVLNNSRFCNIHREHDKVTKWIFENCTTVKQVMLARLVNRIDLLEELRQRQWNTRTFLQREGPITNAGAYQFYPRKGETIKDIVWEVAQKAHRLTGVLEQYGNTLSIKELAIRLSEEQERPLYFYWMMVILDLGAMNLISIRMESEPYAGPGGKKVFDSLGLNLMQLAAELDVKPYTAEHIACEYRKYVERHNEGIPLNRKR